MKLPEDPSSQARVFISYRRRGAADAASRIAAELSTRMPAAVFHDAQIKAGDNFLEAIERRLDVCDVRAAEDRRASLRPQLAARNGEPCWTGVLRGEQETVCAALLHCMAREHRVKWIDTAPHHEITLLRRKLTRVVQLTIRLKPGDTARTTSVEMTADPALRSALERTVAGAVGTRRLELAG